jgi:hypothetical protein
MFESRAMLTYDELAGGLEDAWGAAGLHEHTLIEAVVPDSHDRSFRVELFPEHPDPLTEATMPPWVEVNFTWTALHQLRSEGQVELGKEPLELSWAYNVPAHGMVDRSDGELVRLFQRAVQSAYTTIFPEGAAALPDDLAVEVRRGYRGPARRDSAAYVQLVSTNITDMTELWDDRDDVTLRDMLHFEVHFAAALISALAEVFTPGGRGSYRSVDTA